MNTLARGDVFALRNLDLILTDYDVKMRHPTLFRQFIHAKPAARVTAASGMFGGAERRSSGGSCLSGTGVTQHVNA